MDRLERLVNLVAALLDADRPLTRAEIHRRVGGYSADQAAFRRNFERDKDVLRQMGLPLVTVGLEEGRSDEQLGYRIPRERYELPDPGFTDAELAALRLAASAVRLDAPWSGEAVTSALRKLAALGDPAGGPPGDGTEVAELAGGEAVATLFGAVAERRRVRFTYRGEERTVDPWHLGYRRGQWYLAGFDHLRGADREYRVDRVEGDVRAVGDAAAFPRRPAGGAAEPLPPWRLGDEPPRQVRVLVDASQATWAEAALGAEAVVARRQDGGIEVELSVSNPEGFRSWLFGFLDHAEVLGPPEIRADVVAWLAAMAEAGQDAGCRDRATAGGRP